MGSNREIIKEQNLAAKGRKKINKQEALRRIKLREEEAKILKMK